MKKALLILLALTMIMSMTVLAPVSASAADEETAVGSVAADYKPEGTAVTTAEEFAAMDAAGKYYLAADITVSATYDKDFTGTFDGNGHTITTSTTLFESVNGTVCNLTVSGAVTIGADQMGNIGDNVTGVVAHYAATTADATFNNICNKAPMTSNACGMGAIVGRGCDESAFILTISNCVNYGNITTDINTTSNMDSGGIIASFRGVKANSEYQLIIDNCVNYGTINADGRPGGIIGNCDTSAKVTNCTNNGAVQAIYNYCGGIAGRFGADGYTAAKFFIENCTNNADLYQSCTKLNPDGTNPYKTAQIGGICGFQGNVKELYYKNCVNNGNIRAESKLAAGNFGGITGSGVTKEKNKTPDTKTIIYENCINNGNISCEGLQGGKEANAAGITARAYADGTMKFINCINTGDISASSSGSYINSKGKEIGAKAKAAGICANTQNAKKMSVAYKCFNSGDVFATAVGTATAAGEGNCGGIFAYVLGGPNSSDYAVKGYGMDIQYCVTTGNVTGSHWVSGLVGYVNGYSCTVKNNIVAGQLYSTTPATTVVDGATVKTQTAYTFNDGTNDYYFYVPMEGTVAITGSTVKLTPTQAFTEVANGDTIAKKAYYKFVFEGTTYYGYNNSNAKAALSVTGTGTPVVTIGGKLCQVVTESTMTDIVLFDHPVSVRALYWSNNNTACDVAELATNYIEQPVDANGVAEDRYLDYAQGASNAFNLVGGMSDSLPKTAKAQFATGEVAYNMNATIGDTVFYQNLLSSIFVVDEYPTPDATHAKVIFSAGNYTNLLFDMNPDGTPATGDATVYVVITLAVSAVALAGLVISKKRKVRN